MDGILVPGGFGKRGIAGMVHAITYAREKKIPFFGICLGMQCATIEYARQVSKLEHADSTEFDPSTPNRVIYKLRELLGVDEMGGTMRLGAWPCKLEPGSFAHKAYGTLEISERHRHRYEFNCEYDETLTRAGLPHHRPHARRRLRRDRRSARPSVVHRLPVPSRIQIEAAGAASAVCRVHPRQPRKSPRAAGRRLGEARFTPPTPPRIRSASIRNSWLVIREEWWVFEARFDGACGAKPSTATCGGRRKTIHLIRKDPLLPYIRNCVGVMFSMVYGEF